MDPQRKAVRLKRNPRSSSRLNGPKKQVILDMRSARGKDGSVRMLLVLHWDIDLPGTDGDTRNSLVGILSLSRAVSLRHFRLLAELYMHITASEQLTWSSVPALDGVTESPLHAPTRGLVCILCNIVGQVAVAESIYCSARDGHAQCTLCPVHLENGRCNEYIYTGTRNMPLS